MTKAQSGNPSSAACKKVLQDPGQLKKLKRQCRKPENKNNPVCQAIAPVPDGPGGPTIPPLPIPGLDTDLSAALTDELSSGRASPAYTGLFGFEPFGSGGAT